ncbi:Arginine-binding extracellular protein ArtP precursor [Achromobacter xylosoxidans]|uniref:substrate-binding periplasmic protein n=1 Tax=Alcaligenes xylosoxydans xylosoxydans TaxID=85698 RepID=UPI0006C21934|nr:transporter substrate-binding domain-containing protein [Achromobacter xylosoxidans]MCH4591790.1 transporter substrate-binding domain-containing protein [Achromobacter xylosoxidans]CUJ21801.1 Arginine-binding extracellular protein ArtP precursor [Achromobacter xylosoxidans]
MQLRNKGSRAWHRAAAMLSACALAAYALAAPAMAQEAPAAGQSARIDAIRKAGELRVGVLQNAPWLLQDVSGKGGEGWSGPAWLLAKEYARLLGVKLTPVQVSHETKVPVLAANQVDMTISPLAETPERLKVVDFVLYSSTSVCLFGLASNPKLAAARSVDDLNRPGVTIAYFTGGAEEAWVKQRFPNATLRAVANSGATAPIEEIMAKRADAAPINRVPWVGLNRKVRGLAVLPAEANCQQSTEKASPVGLAIDKNQPEYLAWLRQVAAGMKTRLDADEMRIIEQTP